MTTKYVSARKAIREITGHISFGQILWAYRMGEEITQVELAKMLGISKQDLCNIEKGRKFVSVERARDFALKLGESPIVFIAYVLEDQLHRAGIDASVKINVA